MQQVENFNGTRKDKQYIYLDEMLTRNLLKLDNIETEGKDNIRALRREAIKCIQEYLNKLEAKGQAFENQLEPKTEEQTKEELPAELTKKTFKSEAKIEIKPLATDPATQEPQEATMETEIKEEPTPTNNPAAEEPMETSAEVIPASTEASTMEVCSNTETIAQENSSLITQDNKPAEAASADNPSQWTWREYVKRYFEKLRNVKEL